MLSQDMYSQPCTNYNYTDTIIIIIGKVNYKCYVAVAQLIMIILSLTALIL